MDETRALLDALMGPNRNQTQTEKPSNVPEFADKSICKHFLVGFCPHDWFSMPKRQLMPCNKIHSELMKEKFEQHPEVAKYKAFYEEDFLHYLQPIARDCDNYIVREKGKCRPKMATGKSATAARMPTDVQAKFEGMERRYAELVRQSEEAADAASLGLSKELMGQALVLKEDIDTVKEKYTMEFQGEDICEVCGVRYPLGQGGAEWHDKESHKRGKTHQGFSQIREKIDELITKRREWDKYRSQRRDEYEPQMKREREQAKPAARERDRSGRRERDRPREKDRDKDEQGRSVKLKEKEIDRKERHGDRSRKHGRSPSSERSRSRRRRESGSRGGHHKEPPSPPPAAKERDPSSDRSRGRREKEKEKDKDKDKKKKGEEPPPAAPPPPPKRPPSSGRRSPDYSQDALARPPPPSKPDESDEEQEKPEEEKDGITVLEEDLPEFWARIQKLKGNVRNEAVAVLSTATKDRLEKWLISRVRKRAVSTPATAKVGA